MGKLLISFLIISSIHVTWNQLIRSNYVYEEIVIGIHDYFNSTCILFLHSTPDPIEAHGIEENTKLKELQEFFSKRYIRTAIIDLETLITRISEDYYRMKRPLLVLLNDSDELRYQFENSVAPFVDLTYPKWLIFFRNETKIDNFFNDIYIPFDCVFMISQSSDVNNNSNNAEIISEAYQIDRGKDLRVGLFAKWNEEDGMELPKRSLYQRRDNLYGHELRVLSIEDPPSSMIMRDEANVVVGLGGFFGGVINLLKESMNFTISYQVTNEWGYLKANGSWTGGIYSLIKNETDIFAGELVMTNDRLNVITFTTPLYTTKCRTYIKRPATSALKWNAYITPFTEGVWSAIALIIILTASVMYLMKLFASPLWTTDDSEMITFSNTIFNVFGALCSQGMTSSNLDAVRIVHNSIYLTGVVLLAAYSAALISSLAVKTFVMPFTTMEGLVEDKTYRFGVVANSADFTFFQHTSDEVMKVLFENILVKEINLPINYLDGLTRVCNENKYAFMTLDNIVGQLKSSLNCIVMPLDVISQMTIAMALQPHSPYRGLIDNKILLLRDSGILQKLLNSAWTFSGDDARSVWTIVEFTEVLPLLMLLICAICLSVIFLLNEKLFFKNRQKSNKQRTIKRLIANIKFPIDSKIPV